MSNVASESFDGYGALFKASQYYHLQVAVKSSQIYRERVKSCGAVPNWKDRSNLVAKSFNPLLISLPFWVSKLSSSLVVWNYSNIQNASQLSQPEKKSHLISNTVGIQIPTRKCEIFIAVSLVQICTYTNVEKTWSNGQIYQEDILNHPRLRSQQNELDQNRHFFYQQSPCIGRSPKTWNDHPVELSIIEPMAFFSQELKKAYGSHECEYDLCGHC